MKVDMGTIEADDFLRLALRERVGKAGLAGRVEVRQWAREAIRAAANETVNWSLKAAVARAQEPTDG